MLHLPRANYADDYDIDRVNSFMRLTFPEVT